MDSGERVEAGYIVVETESDSAPPFKPTANDIKGLRSNNARVNSMLNTTETVTIVAISRQLLWSSELLPLLADGGKVEDQKPCKLWGKIAILVPLGSKKALVLGAVHGW